MLFLLLPPPLAMLWCLSHSSLLLASHLCLWFQPAQPGLLVYIPVLMYPVNSLELGLLSYNFGYIWISSYHLSLCFLFLLFLIILSLSFFFPSLFFLFTALELIYSISVLLMHGNCVRFTVSWCPYLFLSNARIWGCFI